jgi:hypothetical protein
MFKTIAIAAACVVGSGAAEAAVMQATWTGTVFSGTDATNYWGTGNTDIAGQKFSLVFVYDTSLGGRQTVPGGYDRVFGGKSFGGGPSPVQSVQFTIGHLSASFAGNDSGDILTEPAATGRNYFTISAADTGFRQNGDVFQNFINGIFYDFGQNPHFSPDLVDTPFSVSGLAQDCNSSFCGGFLLSEQVPFVGNYNYFTTGLLAVDSIDVRYAAPAAVPLPASALLLAGAFAAAAGVRRIRLRAAA